MPSLLTAIGAIFRAGLLVAAGYLVQHNIWTQEEATRYAGELATFLALIVGTVGYSLFKTYVYERAIKIALFADPGTSVTEVKQAANPIHPTPASMAPVVARADAATTPPKP